MSFMVSYTLYKNPIQIDTLAGNDFNSSQGFTAFYSSWEEIRGSSYPCRLTKFVDGTCCVQFGQFTFGTAFGDTEEEALRDASEVLGTGFTVMLEVNKAIPSPVDMEAARGLLHDRRTQHGKEVQEVKWVNIPPDPGMDDGEDGFQNAVVE